MTDDCRYVTSSDGLKICADSNGNTLKPALVFIHGNRMTGGVFDTVFANEKFAGDFHLIRYDLRGQGRSGHPGTADGHVSKLYADDFAAVCDAFNVKRPYLVGWSYGCTILADIAANLPQDYLSGAVNIGGKPYVGSDPSNVLKPAMLAVLHKLGPSVPAEEFEAALAQFPGLLFSDVDKVPWDVKWRWRGMMSNASPSSYMLTVTREVDSAPLLALARKGFPLHVIVGADDQMVSAEGVLAEVSKNFTNLTSLVVEKGSHAVFYESTEVVLDSITSFVRSKRWTA